MQINFTLIGQMLTFALLVYLTMKYIWPPITNAMHERAKKIAEGLAAAEQGERSLETARVQAEHMLQEAKSQVTEMFEQAQKRASVLLDEAREEARHEAKQIIQQAHQDIKQQMHHARRELKTEVGHLAINIAQRVIEHKMDAAANANLVDELLERI